tara:strand:- start:3922 stop:4236 length:315 start_codon:yes stop_codon:yes gene_type:complete
MFFVIFVNLEAQTNASEIEAIEDSSYISINNSYIEKFCSAKADNFFEGLENEKALKFSYFRYIGLNNTNTKDHYKSFIEQIKRTCFMSENDEKDLYEYLLKESD